MLAEDRGDGPHEGPLDRIGELSPRQARCAARIVDDAAGFDFIERTCGQWTLGSSVASEVQNTRNMCGDNAIGVKT
ncbi:MAG: hypothetical protein ACRDUX_03465 [Mycobacterium sp.]